MNSTKLKILVIPAWFNHKNKNEGIFIHEFCEALQRNGIDTALLYVKSFSIGSLLSYFKPIKFNLEKSYEIIVVKHLKILPNRFYSNYIVAFKHSIFNTVLKKLKNRRFDCIHSQSLCNNITPYLAVELAKKYNSKHIVTEHYTSYEEAKESNFKPFISKDFVISVLNRSTKNIAVSSFAAALYKKYFDIEFTVIPNIISMKYFEKPFVNISTKKFVFCFIGALEERKGIMELLEAFKKMDESNVILHVIGNGSEYNKVLSFMTYNNLQDRVFLHGRRSTDEVIDLIDASNALVSPSNLETFGLVIVESHLRGRPVIAVNSGAVTDLIDSSNGIISDSNDKINNLVVSMKNMILNYSNYHLLSIRQNSTIRFNEKKIINQYKEIYLS